MLVRCSRWLVVVTLSLSIGFHWAFLQSIAWVGMAINYSRECPVSEALSKTFDGKHLCKLCKLVRDGKQSESKSETKVDLKRDFAIELGEIFIFRAPARMVVFYLAAHPLRSEPPSLPPPLSA